MSNPKNIWLGIISKINPIHNLGIVPLEPGYELDRLIAEKVLGWYQDSDIGGPRAWWFEKDKADEIMGSGPYPTEQEALHLNHYSTDIKAAWDLVEKFRLIVRPFGKTGWTAVKKWCDDEMTMMQNMAPTAPHAICLAALFYASEDDE